PALRRFRVGASPAPARVAAYAHDAELERDVDEIYQQLVMILNPVLISSHPLRGILVTYAMRVVGLNTRDVTERFIANQDSKPPEDYTRDGAGLALGSELRSELHLDDATHTVITVTPLPACSPSPDNLSA
ncbi:hypothetical protein PQX77_005421, partial [Marasmius sp. AFHP31]